MTQPPDGTAPPPPDADPPDTHLSAPDDHPPAPGDHPTPPGGLPPVADPSAAPSPGSRSRLGLVITGAALAAALALAGVTVVAWLLWADRDRDGAPEAVDAVDAFLTAVYQEQDAEAASEAVCAEARDIEELESQVATVQGYHDTYASPRFTWDEPEVVEQNGQVAVVAVTVTMITAQEQIADQELRVSVLDKDPHGWWVCNVDSVSPEDDPATPDADEE